MPAIGTQPGRSAVGEAAAARHAPTRATRRKRRRQTRRELRQTPGSARSLARRLSTKGLRTGTAVPHQRVVDTAFRHLTPAERDLYGPKIALLYSNTGRIVPRSVTRYRPGSRRQTIAREKGIRAELTADQGSDLSRAIEVGTLAIPGTAVVKVARAAAGAVRAARAAKAATAAGRTAEAAKTVRAARAAEKVGKPRPHTAPWLEKHLDRVRLTDAERAAASAGKAARAPKLGSRAARSARAVRANRAVRTATAPARFAGRHSGKAFGAAVAAPLAVSGAQSAQQGSLEPLKNALETGGTVGRALSEAGQSLSKLAPSGVARNIIQDAFDLPAQALPAVYLPLAGIVEAAQGDSSRLRELWKQYKAIGAIPAIVEGKDPLKAIERHPLFSALELSGARAVAGRSLGAAGRAARVKAAGTKRAPLKLGGDLAPVERRYSPDVFEKVVQAARDRRRGKRRGGQVASPHERSRYLRERVDRVVGESEQIRRQHRTEEAKAAKAARPKRRRDADVVALAVQGIVRSPRTFHEDLAAFARQLDEAHASGELTRSQRIANRELAAAVKLARKSGIPRRCSSRLGRT